MSQTLSVLLIIGSAVIGPIEAQQSGRAFASACYASDDAYHKCRVKAGGAEPHTETLPQLCERAMREIGAVEVGAKTALLTGDDANPLYRSQVVRCIPVPAGYRR